MRNAPPTFLVLPPAGDDAQARLLDNLRLLALRPPLSRRELGSVDRALAEVLAREPAAVLEAVGALAEIDHAAGRDPQFGRRRREVIESNGRGLDTLERLGRPTEVGRRLLDGLRQLHEFTAAAI